MKLTHFFIFILLISTSCIKNNPKPSWLKINQWNLIKNLDVEEGELSHNFSDVYITIDDKIIGIFELPVKLPLLLSGEHTLKLYPVIKNNGISATKKIYPFCEPMVINSILKENETIEINPKTKYYTNTNFWIEDFENTITKLDDSFTSSLAKIKKDNQASYLKYGNFYGHVNLNKVETDWFCKLPPLILPKNGSEVYLEIDYITTNNILTGLYAISNQDVKDNPNIQLNAQNLNEMNWKKIYIELKEIVSYSSNATIFENYFKAILDQDKSESNIYLDNIKIVNFK